MSESLQKKTKHVEIKIFNISHREMLDVYWCGLLVSAPAENHQQLLGLPCVELEAVLLAPVHKVLSPKANICKVIRELVSYIEHLFWVRPGRTSVNEVMVPEEK